MHQPPEFSVEVTRRPDGLVVAPRGEVDLSTVDEVRAACASHREGVLVLDLRAVEYLDTSALNLVLECQRRCDGDGSAFALVRGPARVQRLFEIAGVTHRLPFVDDPPEALGDGRPAG